MAGVPYRNAVGCLMYLMVGTRPDLAAAVGVLSQFAADPCPTHWQALKRVFRYIQGTRTHGIEFQTAIHIWTARIFGCGLGRRYDVAKKHKRLCLYDERRVYQLEEQETAYGGTIIYGS
mgnify:CR=1 FL=1